MPRQKMTTLDLLTPNTLAEALGCSAALIRWYEAQGVITSRRLRTGKNAMRVYDFEALRAARAWREGRALPRKAMCATP